MVNCHACGKADAKVAGQALDPYTVNGEILSYSLMSFLFCSEGCKEKYAPKPVKNPTINSRFANLNLKITKWFAPGEWFNPAQITLADLAHVKGQLVYRIVGAEGETPWQQFTNEIVLDKIPEHGFALIVAEWV